MSIPGYKKVSLPDCCYTCSNIELPKELNWWYCSLYNKEINVHGWCPRYNVVT
jgi:hypothetical protein